MIPEQFHLWAKQLSDKYPTPFYIVDLDRIRHAYVAQYQTWTRYFPLFHLAYSYKTNPLRSIVQTLCQAGAWAEVVSATELHWALEDGFVDDNILFDGPVKTVEELRIALKSRARIQIDSLTEVHTLVSLQDMIDEPPNISARLAMPYKSTISRFGLSNDEYYEAAILLEKVGMKFRGIHAHVGSNQNDPTIYGRTVSICAPYVADLMASNCAPVWLDIGGGFPANSIDPRVLPRGPEEYASEVAAQCTRNGLRLDKLELITEPGRSLVEDHAILVTRVAAIKARPMRPILVVDAGTNLVRSLKNWFHPIEFLRPSGALKTIYDIYGALCFESDTFATAYPGPSDIEVGDVVLIGEAGGYDMPSANVWTRPAPAIYGQLGGHALELRRQQRGDEVRRLDVALSRASTVI